MPALMNHQSDSTSSDESPDIELQERFSIDGEQTQRLLSDESTDQEHEDEEYTLQQLKPAPKIPKVWAITGLAIGVLLVTLGVVLFIQRAIVGDYVVGFNPNQAINEDFRRPLSDYILTTNWNFGATPRVRKYKWTILDRMANPDGVVRPLITINGLFPGPMIECNEGDTIIIDVDNQSVNATTIHFHGIFQNGTNWMDGSPGITQCPIGPGSRYQYKFTITGQSGTYFYHGHQAVQISDGLYGPIVVHSKDEKTLQPIPYTTDRIIMLQDYWYDLSSGVLKTTLEPGHEGPPIPDAALLNGLNQRDCSTIPNRVCDNATATLASIDLTPNENHRLRFINVGASSWFEVSLDEHPLAFTEVDGTNIAPVYANQMQIAPSQRYSTVITANLTTSNAFVLNARMITHCFTDPSLPGEGLDTVRALVTYSARNDERQSGITESTQQSARDWNIGFSVECRDMDNTQFKPLRASPAPVTADYSYYIRNNIQIGNWRLERGFFNTSSWRPDLRSPSLHRVIEGLQSNNESFSAVVDGLNEIAFHLDREFVLQHTGVKVVDLIIQNFDEQNHPLHLHGHKFWVLGQGHAYFPGYDKLDLDLSNPIRRDTAGLEGFGWMLIRFVTDNPGIWAFHCHTAWHSEAGLLMQFLSQPETIATWQLPEANRKLCEADGLENGATPKDEIWFGFGTGS